MYAFENKLVAVLNKSIPPGNIMNALAHMCIGAGAGLGSGKLLLVDYHDKSGNVYRDISKMPFIVLKANSSKINGLRKSAREFNIYHSVFTDTMTIGTWEEQIERTKSTEESELTYMGIVLFGKWDLVSEMTKKFSLYQ